MDAAPRRQPKGFYFLFVAEMCERFAFYTLVFLLALYLTDALGMADDPAGVLYGAVTAFVYLATVVGGIVADRVLGHRRAIVLGASVSAAGFALLFLADALYIGLAAVITGTGLFKVNVTSLLACLYSHDDDRQEGGFSLYYMGINAGSFAASLISGYVATQFGYHWAFAMAGVGQLFAMGIFLVGSRSLQDLKGPPPGTGRSLFDHHGVLGLLILAAGAAFATGLVAILLQKPEAAGATLAVFGLVALGYFMLEMRHEARQQRRKLTALLVLFLFAVMFWAVYGQSALSVILYLERSVNRDILGYTVAATSFESLNPAFVLLTAPFFSWLWIRLARKHLNPSVPAKFLFGLIFLASAYFALALGGKATPNDSLAPPAWFVAFFFLLTCGEMCVSPVGLSIVGQLTPHRLLGFGMGMWFLAEAIANYMSGIIAEVAAIPANATIMQERSIYEDAFADYGWLALAAAAALVPLVAMVRRLIEAGSEGDGGKSADSAPSAAPQSDEARRQ